MISPCERVQVKALLRRERQPGLFSGRYRFSPYMACGHRCIYCDGRHEKYHVDGDFDRDIVARINAPDLLEKELGKLREPGPVCISSGISDPYQPAEAELCLTRRCAEVLADHDFPVVIHTKSALALRDLDLWKKVSERSAVTLMVSLTTALEEIRQLLEPGASSVEQRLKTISEFRAAGMNAGVLAMPFIPFLTDSPEQMQKLLEKLNAAGAQFAVPGLLTLKPGRQKEHFLCEAGRLPGNLSAELAALYSGEERWGNPPRGFQKAFEEMAGEIWARQGMPDMIPHGVYRNQFTLYDHFTILLGDMIHLYRRAGTDTRRLENASRRFGEWVDGKRRHCALRRKLHYSVIDEVLREMTASGELAALLQNRKLAAFLERVALGSVFSYRTMTLLAKGEEE